MRFISCHDGKLQTLETAGLKASPQRSFVTGLEALDGLAPQGRFARGAVHELLFDADAGKPVFAASVLARAASACVASLSPSPGTPGEGWGEGSAQLMEETRRSGRARTLTLPSPGVPGEGTEGATIYPIIWSDPSGEIYPPALTGLGFDLAKTYLLRTSSDEDEAWAVAECLRCRGVGVVIAALSSARAGRAGRAGRNMSRIEARRLQLAAERGASVGILLRETGRGDDVYAAATRWKVSPLPGERTVQRWTIRLLHGHGGRVGESVILEWRRERENHLVRALEKLPDRPSAAQAPRRATA